MYLNFSNELRKQARLVQLSIYGLKHIARSDRKATLSFLVSEGEEILENLNPEVAFAVEKLSSITKENVRKFISGK
ncbi:MAG TPA: hypothetical protein PLP33_25225 [Leptospiraceae bacterium]|nr:hypothetical protein [Leptospiraceae bacterium]